MRRAIVLCLLLSGCPAGPLQGGAPDGGASPDLAATPDLALPTCAAVQSAMQQWIAAHQSCATNSDCAYVPYTCCEAIANAAAQGPYYSSLLAAMKQLCPPALCNCPFLPPASCNQGVCVVGGGNGCVTAGDCNGPLPAICQQCADGSMQCAHHACEGGQCTIEICPPTTCTGYLDVAADNGAPRRYASICANSWGAAQTTSALGYRFEGGPAPGIEAMDVAGCASAAPSSEGVQLSARNASSPGTFTTGSVSYTDANGIQWGVPGDPLSITFTRIDAVGGVIAGSFTATVTHGGNAAHSLSGAFQVCRVNDELAP